VLKALALVAPFLTLATVAVLGVAGSFFTPSPLAIALYLVAIGLTVWARRSFTSGSFRAGARPGGSTVIRKGPYRYMRHPMYAGALLLIWTAALVRLAWWSVALAALVTLAATGRIVWEERLLRSAFNDYADYARSTRAVVPYVI
jgi:protein-S-isoprenylcysteine O-methyltransferase Ste14